MNTIGKHKVPRYIYHITTQKNYRSILNDGLLKTTEDPFCGKGVFAIELINFFKRWKEHKDWKNSILQSDLIEQVRNFTDGLVILRIPTRNLEMDKLRIRSQNKLFSWKYEQENNIDKINDSSRRNKLIQLYNLLYNTTTERIANHITQGSPAKQSSLFTRRKEAIEYIYQDDIPVNKLEKIGEIAKDKLRYYLWLKTQNPIKNIFLELLKHNNEINGAELLKWTN